MAKLVVDLVCIGCGKEFTRIPSRATKYCSKKCYLDTKRNQAQLTCLQCGNNFSVAMARANGGQRKYCSKSCYHESQKDNLTAVCKRCGCVFATTASRAKYGKGKYCSVECQHASERTSLHINCLECGKVFTSKPANIKRGNGKYCSKECYAKSLMQGKSVKCIRCGRYFWTIPTAINRGGGKYCSVKCRAADKVGPNAANWHGGKTFEPYCYKFNDSLKEQIRENFGRACYLCGSLENGKKHSIHHVDYDKSQGCKGTQWALIPLCNACHARTGHNRWHWFNLLRDYWLNNYIDFTMFGGLI